MSRRILFVMLHPGFIRYYEDALLAMADRGDRVHVAFEITREKLGEDQTAQWLATANPNITCGTTPARAESVRTFLARGDRSATRSGDLLAPQGHRSRETAWESLATTVRLLRDYLRYFEAVFAAAVRLRDRAEKRLPRIYVRPARLLASNAVLRRACAAVLRGIECVIPPPSAIQAFIAEQDPDLLIVTPLIELGSQQVDYVKAARARGVRTALCVASWDNLTSKGLIRVPPDHVLVWNDAQKEEARSLHGVAADRVVVTGAQLFDHWFAGRPSRSRTEFCHAAGLDPERPFVVYVGSSMFIAPDEVPFVERWLRRLRADRDPVVAGAGVLLRPHPANARPWRTLDCGAFDNVAVWPPIGTGPNAPDFRRDYFDSLYFGEAVVGINTSAQIEAGILGKPVFTIRAPEFRHSQGGTLHFQHLVAPGHGLVRSADSLDEHVRQLTPVLHHEPRDRSAELTFIREFLRPQGIDVPVAPKFAESIGRLADLPRPTPVRGGIVATTSRPAVFGLALIARALAEDRPLWVYAIRPFLASAIWCAAAAMRASDAVRDGAHSAAKRARRCARRSWHESSTGVARWWHRARKTLRTTRAAARRAFVR